MPRTCCIKNCKSKSGSGKNENSRTLFEFPHKFLDDADDVNTYADVLTRSIRTAIHLQKFDIQSNDIISCCTHNHKDSCIPFIATQYLGAISASFDPKLSHLDTVYLLQLINPKLLFVTEEALGFIESCLNKANVSTKLVVFGSSDKYMQFSEFIKPCKNISNADIKPCSEEENFRPIKIKNQKDTAAILFSSGTTGLPKGICLNHKSLIKASDPNDLLYTIKDNCVMLTFSTLYWISAVYNIIRCVSNGYSQVVRRQFDPEYTWTLIEKYQVTFMFLAPYDAVDFLNHKPKRVNVSSLEIFMTGSCPVTRKLMEDLKEAFPQTKILHGYGCTEVAGCAASFDGSNEDEYNMQLLKPTSCGKIRNGIKLRIVDMETEEVLGPNKEGEIRIKGESMMNEYYKIDSSTAFDIEGYLKTGDIGYYDEDECLYVSGRIKEMFKYRGWHIIPSVIEKVLATHPAVKESAVVGLPHVLDGSHPMGLVVLFKEYEQVAADEIEKFVNERVSESQKLRAGVKIVENLPKTTTGKLNRTVLNNWF